MNQRLDNRLECQWDLVVKTNSLNFKLLIL
jgi:hypothetical protein